MSPKWGSTPRLIGSLTISHNVSLTLTLNMKRGVGVASSSIVGTILLVFSSSNRSSSVYSAQRQ
jgi:hypothetical protein